MTITFWQVLQAGFWVLAGIAPMALGFHLGVMANDPKRPPDAPMFLLTLWFALQAFFGVALYIAGTVDG